MNKKKIALIIGLIVIYYFLINSFAQFYLLNDFSLSQVTYESINGDVNIGFGDSVNVLVNRNRWYGNIIESSQSSFLNLSIFILPLRIKDINFIYIHGFFILFVFLVHIFTFKRKNEMKGGVKNGSLESLGF